MYAAAGTYSSQRRDEWGHVAVSELWLSEVAGEQVGGVEDGSSGEDGGDEEPGRGLLAAYMGEEVAGRHLEEEAGGDGEQDNGTLEREAPPDGEQAAGKRGERVGEEEGVVAGAGAAALGGEDDGVHAVGEIVSGDADRDRQAGRVRGGIGQPDGHAVAQAVKDEQSTAELAEGAAAVLPAGGGGGDQVLQGKKEEEREQRDAENVSHGGGLGGADCVEGKGFGQQVKKGGAEQKSRGKRGEEQHGAPEADRHNPAEQGGEDGDDEQEDRHGRFVVMVLRSQ